MIDYQQIRNKINNKIRISDRIKYYNVVLEYRLKVNYR